MVGLLAFAGSSVAVSVNVLPISMSTLVVLIAILSGDI